MLGQPNLSQSKQPKDHYDYDGLSGGWLWFPWWVHLICAALFWPICWWLLPTLPFQNENITEFLFNYRLKLAIFLSVCTCMTALMSFIKARKIKNRKRSVSSRKVIVKDSVKPKASRIKTEASRVVSAKAAVKKNTTVKEEKTKQQATKAEGKAKAKPKAKKATKKKKDDSQLQLDF